MKKGISLIVLVITIIVMIILASSVVVTLSNTGIINRASEAVELTNEKQVQDMAAIIWADVFMNNKRGQDLIDGVTTKLAEQGVTADKWNITVTATGVTVTNKNSALGTGLGSMITADNYGDKVDYSVTVNGTVYDDWQIYYHNKDYVYLIAENNVENISLTNLITVESLTAEELALYEKFMVGNASKYTLTDMASEHRLYSSQAVAKLIRDYSNFANKTTYGEDVVGAIGGPTIELIAEGWNSKGYMPKISLTTDLFGYWISGNDMFSAAEDELYLSSVQHWVASPPAGGVECLIEVSAGDIAYRQYNSSSGIRPVVCLKASIPATVGTGEYDFNLVK